jgi:hypothetical protein
MAFPTTNEGNLPDRHPEKESPNCMCRLMIRGDMVLIRFFYHCRPLWVCVGIFHNQPFGHCGGVEAAIGLIKDYHGGQDPIRRRWSPLDLEPGRCAAAAVGVKPDRADELVGFYHAVVHLGKIAALRRWTAADRQAWIGRQRRRLLKGGVEEVQAAIDAVCGSRPDKALKRERDYFKRDAGKGRMDYARMAAMKLPIGSGAIESAIRRVVNLRLKGPSIDWHKTSAEAVLLLRSCSYHKAGRWNHLERQALTTTTGIAT